jgi:hypothetical protein
MAVFAGAVVGTIGGGHLEYQAIAAARARLPGACPADGDVVSTARLVLGPSRGSAAAVPFLCASSASGRTRCRPCACGWARIYSLLRFSAAATWAMRGPYQVLTRPAERMEDFSKWPAKKSTKARTRADT